MQPNSVFPPFCNESTTVTSLAFKARAHAEGGLFLYQSTSNFMCFLPLSPLYQPFKGHSSYSTNTVLMRNVLNFQEL